MKTFKSYVTEVSTGKLVDYVAAASKDVGRRVEKAEPGEKPFKKILNRSGKIGRAMAHIKMKTEEVEQIDELSTEKLQQYKTAAKAHISKLEKDFEAGDRSQKRATDIKKRDMGVAHANQKIRKAQQKASAPASTPAKPHKILSVSQAIAQDYKDQEKKRGIGHVRDHVEHDGEVISELNRDTVYSYSVKADKDMTAKHRVLGPQIKAGNVDAANKTAHKITRRSFGLDRAVDRLNKEEFVGFKSFFEEAKPHEIHVSPAKNGQYKVHAVGSKFAHGIKVGEHLSDTHLDDFSEMGGKVKMVKAKKD